jgi:hypothetical protein
MKSTVFDVGAASVVVGVLGTGRAEGPPSKARTVTTEPRPASRETQDEDIRGRRDVRPL